MHRTKSASLLFLSAVVNLFLLPSAVQADGFGRPPKLYKGQPYSGSIEERSQEAIIIFHSGEKPGDAREDMILKISVEGDVDQFAWLVPFPAEPKTAPEDAQLFREVFDYVEARLEQLSRSRAPKASKSDGATKAAAESEPRPVDVLSRKVVGSYDVAIVRENEAGALNDWLDAEGYQAIPAIGDDVMQFYREKKYVFACIKVDEAQLNADEPVDLHPLRFTFKTGGRDGIYFPMKLTGLQESPFDVNLYVFYGAWLNDHLNKFGYEHRGFTRKYRDWDSPECEANAGKSYSSPQNDPFLKSMAHRIPLLAALLQKLHPGERYYLTNIQARGLKPADVREWSDDLWLFPYYTNTSFVPYDVRDDGPAATAWPGESGVGAAPTSGGGDVPSSTMLVLLAMGLGVLVLGMVGILTMVAIRRHRRTSGMG